MGNAWDRGYGCSDYFDILAPKNPNGCEPIDAQLTYDSDRFMRYFSTTMCCLFLGTIVLLWLVNRFTMKTFAQISSEAESNDGVAYHGDATVALPSMGGNQLEDLAAQGKHDEELRMEEASAQKQMGASSWAPSTIYAPKIRALRWLLQNFLMLLIVLGSLIFGLWYVEIFKLAQGDIRTAYWTHRSSRVGIFMHLLFGGLWYLFGPFQFIPAVRVRWPKFHRVTGYLFVLAQILCTIGVWVVIAGPYSGHNGGFGTNLFTWIWTTWW